MHMSIQTVDAVTPNFKMSTNIVCAIKLMHKVFFIAICTKKKQIERNNEKGNQLSIIKFDLFYDCKMSETFSKLALILFFFNF